MLPGVRRPTILVFRARGALGLDRLEWRRRDIHRVPSGFRLFPRYGGQVAHDFCGRRSSHRILGHPLLSAPDAYSRYDRHVWIDLLEEARWYSASPPPPWYTAASPWHDDAAVLQSVANELIRIFGRPTSVVESAPYRELDLLPGAEVLAFLARVPAGGATPQSLRRWAHDIATQWRASHPRRLSNER